jgi:hypothetical protein
MHLPNLRIGALAGALASLSTIADASGDWRCDAPIDSFAPPGCVYIPEPDDGICSSFPATGAWTCLSGWEPAPPLRERGPPPSLQGAAPGISPPEHAALALPSARTARHARISLESVADDAVADALVLLGFRQPGATPLRTEIVFGMVEATRTLAVISTDGAGTKTLAVLPLDPHTSTVLASWSTGPGGPRLVLDAGTSRLTLALPGLDHDTRIDVPRRDDVELDLGTGSTTSRPSER